MTSACAAVVETAASASETMARVANFMGGSVRWGIRIGRRAGGTIRPFFRASATEPSASAASAQETARDGREDARGRRFRHGRALERYRDEAVVLTGQGRGASRVGGDVVGDDQLVEAEVDRRQLIAGEV